VLEAVVRRVGAGDRRRAADIRPDQDLAVNVLSWQLREREPEDGEVILGGVRAGVPRPEDRGERLPGLVQPAAERMKPVAVLVVAGRQLLLLNAPPPRSRRCSTSAAGAPWADTRALALERLGGAADKAVVPLKARRCRRDLPNDASVIRLAGALLIELARRTPLPVRRVALVLALSIRLVTGLDPALGQGESSC
jgi:hypothetical protein